jgi:hypothetical protein
LAAISDFRLIGFDYSGDIYSHTQKPRLSWLTPLAWFAPVRPAGDQPMPSYSVSYDLRSPGQNYEPLYAALRKAKAVRALKSLWLLDHPTSSVEVRDILRTMMDANDGLLVTAISNSDWASYALEPGAAEWLKARFP